MVRVVCILIVLAFSFSLAVHPLDAEENIDYQKLLFLEKDGDDGSSHILYKAECLYYSKEWYCTLLALKLNTDKTPYSSCTITVTPLFYQAKAIHSGDAWVLSEQKGACGYTHTYTFGPKGMLQVKSAPAQVPKGQSGFCETFPPKVYHMSKIDSLPPILPVGNCQKLAVLDL